MKQHDVNLTQVANLEKYATQYSRLEDAYIFSHLTSESRFDILPHSPMRVNGLTILLCLSGSIDLTVNLDDVCITAGTIMTVRADCLIHVRHIDWSTLDAYLFVISPEFLRDINLDVNLLNRIRVAPQNTPLMKLDTQEMGLLKLYFDLIHYNTKANSETMYVRSISRCLIAAAVYQVMQFVVRHFDSAELNRSASRRSNYVSDFMQLVFTHHCRERSVAFYASKLFISPKYLSMIIKEATGRSATDWIDAYVLLEAKNLLRFSGKNVQQIAYELNFSNQSSFGKYFKHLTGMSPTQFQKS